jgi:hypothetical protein
MKFPKGFLDKLASRMFRRQITDGDIPHRGPWKYYWTCRCASGVNERPLSDVVCPSCGMRRPHYG